MSHGTGSWPDVEGLSKTRQTLMTLTQPILPLQVGVGQGHVAAAHNLG